MAGDRGVTYNANRPRGIFGQAPQDEIIARADEAREKDALTKTDHGQEDPKPSDGFVPG